MAYFVKNNLFSNKEFGFINGRSTVLQLLHVLDIWVKNLEEGGQIDVIYIDFAKAFDKVPHQRLISKLRSYGISEQLILWISDFLSGTGQRVKINNFFFKMASGIKWNIDRKVMFSDPCYL